MSLSHSDGPPIKEHTYLSKICGGQHDSQWAISGSQFVGSVLNHRGVCKIDSGNQVHTLGSTAWEAELHSCINDQESGHHLDETYQDLPEASVPSDKDVIRALKVLKLYAIHNPSVLGSIISTESVVYGNIVEKRCYMSQKCLTNFLKV